MREWAGRKGEDGAAAVRSKEHNANECDGFFYICLAEPAERAIWIHGYNWPADPRIPVSIQVFFTSVCRFHFVYSSRT